MQIPVLFEDHSINTRVKYMFLVGRFW